MKRVPSGHLYERTSGIRAFLDDLESMVAELAAAGLDVEIYAGDMQYDSLAELKEHRGAAVREFKILGKNPSEGWRDLEIEFDGADATLSGSSRAELAATAFRLRDHIRGLRSNNSFLKPTVMWGLGVVLTVVSWLFSSGTSLSWGFTVAALIAYTAAFASFVAQRYLNGVRLRRRHEGGFWKRNVDSIVLLIIGAILGAILSEVLKWLGRQL